MQKPKPCKACVDWLSFSIMTDEPGPNEHIEETIKRVNDATRLFRTKFPALLAASQTATKGRKPYKFASGIPTTRLLWGIGLNHATVELTGQGCESARETGNLDFAIRFGQSRATRIDLALDIETDVSPLEFVDAGYNARFASWEHIKTISGETVVIGSKKSQRFVRVYRYYPDHPRAHLLRLEAVHRGEPARQFSLYVLKYGVETAARMALSAYDFKHHDYPPDETEPVTLWRPETHQGGRLRWYRRAVVPAVRDMIESGSLTEREVEHDMLATKPGTKSTFQFKGSGTARNIVKRNATGGYND